MVVYDVMGVGLFHFWILREILVQDPYSLGVGQKNQPPQVIT